MEELYEMVAIGQLPAENSVGYPCKSLHYSCRSVPGSGRCWKVWGICRQNSQLESVTQGRWRNCGSSARSCRTLPGYCRTTSAHLRELRFPVRTSLFLPSEIAWDCCFRSLDSTQTRLKMLKMKDAFPFLHLSVELRHIMRGLRHECWHPRHGPSWPQTELAASNKMDGLPSFQASKQQDLVGLTVPLRRYKVIPASPPSRSFDRFDRRTLDREPSLNKNQQRG